MFSQDSIFNAIQRERAFQDAKYGQGRKHELPAWFLIMRRELEEAEAAWCKEGDARAVEELLQVVAVGVAALEYHGFKERDEVVKYGSEITPDALYIRLTEAH
jgi:hypothetical protein